VFRPPHLSLIDYRNNLCIDKIIFISIVLRVRHEKSPEMNWRDGGHFCYTLSEKHQSTYLHNTETKLGIND
jgi:hypothetical protein